MTNFHVVEPLIQMKRRGAVRFDYEVSSDGAINRGRSCNFAEDWLLASSPVDQLDFALVRLSETVGDDVVPNGIRCFLKPVGHNFVIDEPLIVLQHPQAKPLKLAFGTVMAPEDGERVTYTVNTEGGSSGSPCLTTALEVVALHHWGGPKHNRGVRMSRILAHLESLQLSNLLG